MLMSVADDTLAILQDVTGEAAVRTDPQLQLFELYLLDSFRFVMLLVRMNEQFHTDISLLEIDRVSWATPGQIVAFMERRLACVQ